METRGDSLLFAQISIESSVRITKRNQTSQSAGDTIVRTYTRMYTGLGNIDDNHVDFVNRDKLMQQQWFSCPSHGSLHASLRTHAMPRTELQAHDTQSRITQYAKTGVCRLSTPAYNDVRSTCYANIINLMYNIRR